MDGVVVVAPVESGVLELEGMITGALVVVAEVFGLAGSNDMREGNEVRYGSR